MYVYVHDHRGHQGLRSEGKKKYINDDESKAAKVPKVVGE